jgi:hypothetical protein
MPWQPLGMGRRVLAILALLLLMTACSGTSSDDEPGSGKTTDADCATRIPDSVFDTLRWSPPKPAESTVRGCHRETEQGYIEVRDRTGYDQLCQTLDRTGSVAPGRPVDWLDGRTACAVEAVNGVGATKVVVKGKGDLAVQITVAALTSTDQTLVRAVVDKLAD